MFARQYLTDMMVEKLKHRGIQKTMYRTIITLPSTGLSGSKFSTNISNLPTMDS